MKNSIGVLVCTYNGEKYIEAQLDSLIVQTQLPSEIVIIDDGSTDRTRALLKGYAFPEEVKFQLIFNKKNKGPTKNFLEGLCYLKSDFVAFCDQDDIWLPQKLEVFSNVIATHSADLVFSDAYLMDEEAKVDLNSSLWAGVHFSKRVQENFKADPLDVLFKFPVVTGMCTVVNRLSALRAGIPSWELLHDEWLAYYFACRGKIHFVEQKLAQYRCHSQQVVGIPKNDLFSLIRKFLRKKPKAPVSDWHRLLVIEEFAASEKYSDWIDGSEFQGKKEHLKQRCSIQILNLNSVIILFQELINFRYFKFSAGFSSFAKDLYRSFLNSFAA